MPIGDRKSNTISGERRWRSCCSGTHPKKSRASERPALPPDQSQIKLATGLGGDTIMAKSNLSGMTVQSLLDLRKRVDERLSVYRLELQEQLTRLDGVGSPSDKRKSALKGRKVAPKYRGPNGETWSGRGNRPRWLVAALKGGKKLDRFLIR